MAGKADDEKANGGLFGRLFGPKKRPKKAHMGEQLNLYFNEELKCWVERGKEHEVQAGGVPPPPPRPSNKALPASVDGDDKGTGTSARYAVSGGGVVKSASRSGLAPVITPPQPQSQSGAQPKFFIPPPAPLAGAQPAPDAAGADDSAPAQDAAAAAPTSPQAASAENGQVADSQPQPNSARAIPSHDFAHAPTPADGLAANGPMASGLDSSPLFEHTPPGELRFEPLQTARSKGPLDSPTTPALSAAFSGDAQVDAHYYQHGSGAYPQLSLAHEPQYLQPHDSTAAGANGSANGLERPSFAPSCEMVSMNSQSDLQFGQEREPIDYSTWTVDYWSETYQSDPGKFYYHFYHARVQEGWGPAEWAAYEAEDPDHYSWMTYYLGLGAEGSITPDQATDYAENGSERTAHYADNGYNTPSPETLTGHAADVDVAYGDSAVGHAPPAEDGLQSSAEVPGDELKAEERLHADGDGLAARTNGENVSSHDAAALHGDSLELVAKANGFGHKSGSGAGQENYSGSVADVSVGWIDPDSAQNVHRSAQLDWVDPDDEASLVEHGHEEVVAELAGEYSDDELLLSSTHPAAEESPNGKHQREAPPIAMEAQPTPREPHEGNGFRPPLAERGADNDGFQGGEGAPYGGDGWMRAAALRDDGYANEAANESYAGSYAAHLQGDERAWDHGSPCAAGSDDGHAGRTDSSEAGRGGGSVSDSGPQHSGVEKVYQPSTGSSVYAQAPSLHAPSEVHSEVPDNDAASVQAPSTYSMPLYHNSVIPEVMEMGPMDEPHEVPVLPPMHTEVEPTDRPGYTVHDVAQMEESRRRIGSMSVDVEIASTAAQSDTGSNAEPRFSGNGSARSGGMFGGGGPAAGNVHGGSPCSGSDRGHEHHHGGGGQPAAAAEHPRHVADRMALSQLAAMMTELQGVLGMAAAANEGLDEPLQRRLREFEDRNMGLLDELNMRKIAEVRHEDQQGTVTPYSHLSTPLKSEGGWNANFYLSPGALSGMSTPSKGHQDTLQLHLHLQRKASNPLYLPDGMDGRGPDAMQQLQQQLADVQASLAQLGAENDRLAERASIAEAQLAERNEQYDALNTQLASMQIQLEEAQAQAASSSSHQQAALLQQQLEAQQAAFHELQTEHDDLMACLGQEAAKVEALAGELAQFGVDVDALLEQVEEDYGFGDGDDVVQEP